MFTKGFKKTAFDANAPVRMPSKAAAEGVRKGLAEGQSLSKGWSNLKNEMGNLFGSGSTQNTGKMGS